MMIIKYGLYIEGCPGEKLGIKPNIHGKYKESLYSCFSFMLPKVSNTITIRDTSNTEGGLGKATRWSVVFRSQCLAGELLNLLGKRINEVTVFKFRQHSGGGNASFECTASFKFVGATLLGLSYWYSEILCTLDGNSTSSFLLGTFAFEQYHVMQAVFNSKGELLSGTGAISNIHNLAKEGKKT